MAGSAIAEPATKAPDTVTAQVRKSPQATFLEGMACLRKSDIPCAQVALALIPGQSAYAKLLAGNIAVAQNDFDLAFRLLLPLQAETSLPQEANASLHISLALAYENQEDTLRALEQRVLAESNLTDAADTQTNQRGIWALLSPLSRDQLVEIRGESLDTETQGWIDLALTAQTTRNFKDWHKAYPDHPASVMLEQLTQQYAMASEHPSASGLPETGLKGQIALLLPFGIETFYPVADAIERGFIAAQTIANNNSEIKIYATSGHKDEIAAIYQQAVSAGAQYIIGPLTRDEVTALAGNTTSIPTLALNDPDSPITNENLHNFGLSINDEAVQIVKIARDYGMQTATIVATDNGLASRMAKAFSDAWLADGGQIITQVDAEEGANLADVKAQVSAHPADMILIAATAEQARAIRPYLDVATPTFGFSHIYAGISDEPLDDALTAVRFVDLPWLLNRDDPAFAAYKPAAADLPQGEMQRWFALGADAYQVLLAISRHKATTIAGLCGKIHVSASGEITRELALARFSNKGVVVEKLP